MFVSDYGFSLCLYELPNQDFYFAMKAITKANIIKVFEINNLSEKDLLKATESLNRYYGYRIYYNGVIIDEYGSFTTTSFKKYIPILMKHIKMYRGENKGNDIRPKEKDKRNF